MKIKNTVLFVMTVLFATGCAGMDARVRKTSAELSSAGRRHDNAAISRLAESITASDLSQERLGGYSQNTIRTLFDTLRGISFYLPDYESHAARLGVVFKEKSRRKDYSEDDLFEVHKAYLMSGLFEAASALEKDFPNKGLPRTPQIIPSTDSSTAGWRVYRISDAGEKVELESLAQDGAKVVIVMRPGCEFTEMAANGILADKELGPVFRTNSFMLTRVFDPAGVEAMKQKLSFDSIFIARKSADFPNFSLLRISPTFYFLKDGKTLYTFSGWSNEDDGAHAKQEIHKGLTAIGIDQAPSQARATFGKI